MKRVIIVGTGIPTVVETLRQNSETEREITIVTDNHKIKDMIRSELSLKSELVKPLITTTENYYEKPKSKFHK